MIHQLLNDKMYISQVYWYTFIHCLPLIRSILGSQGSQASLGIKAGYTLDGVPTHRRAHTHTHSLIHSHTTDNFRDTNQPTMHVFGPGEETGVPGACKLHTHGGGGNQTPNPGGVRQTC
ncbi:hypothetical protein QTP70_031639 [Hemibagrus guttatus]|uniref:Uncharacterized protein n=1 Tax=Hemibagrus guttatus TaxID=175788 RepID=A0AAE0VAB4_9TELE|nr:hypothetical protein QTP70_031639 [Hemibagrus guttatus]